MRRMRCERCGAAFYSAAAKTMLERGERCSVCGGDLRLDDDKPPRPLRLVRDGADGSDSGHSPTGRSGS